jgi:hypothetical protein
VSASAAAQEIVTIRLQPQQKALVMFKRPAGSGDQGEITGTGELKVLIAPAKMPF